MLLIFAGIVGQMPVLLGQTFSTITPQATSLVPTPVPVTTVAISRGSFPTLQASIGLKYKPVKQFLMSGNVLISAAQNGLRAEPVPLIGASYTF